MKPIQYAILGFLFVCLNVSACGLTAEEQAVNATQETADAFATQTALAPKATDTQSPTAMPTVTPTSLPTPTKTMTPTATPYGMSKYGNPFFVFTARDDRGWWTVFGTNLDEDPLQYSRLSAVDRTAHMPVWSPDGSYLAWVEHDYKPEAVYYVYVIFDLFSNEVSQPSQQPVNSNARFCWTYDSKYLVWSDHQANSSEMDIYRMEIETGEIIDLTKDSPVWDAFPTCSPVSDAIAFVSDRTEYLKDTDNIWVMDSQGENLRQLTDTPGWENRYPAWSPDGREIAYYHSGYASYAGTPGLTYAPGGVYIVKADGSDNRLLVEAENLMFGASESPAWSPDGLYLAYPVELDESTILYVVSAIDGNIVWSNTLLGRVYDLSWSSNSAFLLFTNEVDMLNQIYILAIADPIPVPMVTLPDNFMGTFAP